MENDTDVALNNMVVTVVSTVSHGELVLYGDGSFTYTPEPDFYGLDSFVYQLVTYPAIQTGWTDEATVTITVRPINDAPIAEDQSVTTPEETAKAITLGATDIENDPLTYAIVAQPAHGTVVLVDNVATYTPALNYTGPDSFTFKANDGMLDSNVATVSITVTPVNDAPVAVDDEYTVAEKDTLTIAAPGVLANDVDVDGDALTAILVDDVSDGTLTLNADGSFTYTPDEYFNGTDSFTDLASDGTLESELAEVVITVTPVNDWPIANDDFYETVTGVLLDVAAPGVLENDVLLDPDEEVSIQILDAPQHGTLSMNDDGSFTYTPDTGFMGTDTFRYQVNSVQINAEWSDDALVTIVVKPYMHLFLPIIWR
jgi:VCBS repeat-containing protein